MIKTFISHYFGFNKQQRNGLLVLVVLSLALLLIRIAYPYFIKPDNIQVMDLPLIKQQLDSADAKGEPLSKSSFASEKQEALFAFDPNTVSLEHLISLGFREKSAKTFLKFRDRGFVFRNKKDLKKIYGISDKFYQKLEPFIVIKPVNSLRFSKNVPKKKFIRQTSPETIELNGCDSAALVEIKGIGPSLAHRIIKYRSLLGGYISTEQLKEVYGLKEENYNEIRSSLTVNPALVRKLDLNTDDFKTINRHPYLNYELTKTIFSWRRKTTITASNLKTILNNEEVYNKLLPYIAGN